MGQNKLWPSHGEAWFSNSIIMERCLQSGGDHKEIEKVMDFNMKLRQVIDGGLDGILFGAPKKRCKRELESREEYLQAIINSLLERENGSGKESEATENEILGYMLLQEIAKCILKFPHTDESMELSNSVTLSGVGDQRDEKIVVRINKQLYIDHANDKANYEELWALNYYAYLMKAKSAFNSSNIEVDQIKLMIPMLEEVIKEIGECLLSYRKYESKLAAERRYETKLFQHCESLSYYMRLDRRLNHVSEIEANQLGKIMCLASEAIHKYARANGPHSLPTITQPFLPTWCQLIN